MFSYLRTDYCLEIGSYCLVDTVSVWNDENSIEMDSCDGCTTMWMYLMPLSYLYT